MAIYLTSDHHFGHENIIRYADRPFSSADEMDAELQSRWNETVTDDDVVYHLGDLCVSSHEYWLRQLNGSLVLLRGNHDRIRPDEAGFPVMDQAKVRAPNGLELTLRHYPKPWSGDGWLIHGHSHASRPAIDLESKRASVCVELTGYRPISLTTIGDELNKIVESHKLGRWNR